MSHPPQTRLRPFQPTSFGGYTLISPLANGGMGELFLARREGSEVACVIKKILPHLASGPDLLNRFIHEARALARLGHQSIARVLDMGIQEERPYLVLEYVDGKDLRKVVSRARERDNGFPQKLTLYVLARVLDALAYAHDTKDEEGNTIHLVHRDISPPNILISYEGEVKVIDFGLAKSTLHTAKTHPSLLLGKFLYMSPEQARHLPVDRRSDLYSVGVCLYEMLTGQNPFEGLAPAELLGEIAQPTFIDRRPLEGEVPNRLAAAVRRAVELDPTLRFPTAAAFRDELFACIAELDATVAPADLGAWMKLAFANEYTAERRLLRVVAEVERIPPGRRETGVFRLPGHPTPSASQAHPTPNDTRPTPDLNEVVPLSFSPSPRNHDSDEVGMVADAPTSPGRYEGEPKTQPEVMLDLLVSEHPTQPPQRAVDPPELPPRVDSGSVGALSLGVSGSKAHGMRSALWLLGPLLIGLSGLAVYLGYDLYRTGFFVASGHSDRPAWNRTAEPMELDEEDLAPLVNSLNASGSLSATWKNHSSQFLHFRHARGCVGQVNGALCQRHQVLAGEVGAALSHGEERSDELLVRIRELSRDIAEADKNGSM